MTDSHEAESDAGSESDAEAAAAAPAFSAASIKQVMSEAGPLIRIVRLCADGSCQEHEIDSSPSANAISLMLGGRLTFLGQWKVSLHQKHTC